MSKVKCIVAHPDDEVIWFAPFLRQFSEGVSDCTMKKIDTVVCLTCKDNFVRSKELSEISVYYKFDVSIYSSPIIRRFSYKEICCMRDIISDEFSDNTDVFFTHALYGDDHFHPQHIIISLICLYYSVSVHTHSTLHYTVLFRTLCEGH